MIDKNAITNVTRVCVVSFWRYSSTTHCVGCAPFLCVSRDVTSVTSVKSFENHNRWTLARRFVGKSSTPCSNDD